MRPKGNSQLSLIALILSIMALVIASVSYLHSYSELSEENFMIKLETAIEKYVEKQKLGIKKKEEHLNISVDDDPIKGSKKAPVTIVEFSDFECPFCARFYQTAYPKLVSEYIDTGKVKLVFRDFPLSFHRNAKMAAMAAECVNDQLGDKAYFLYHNKMYENQKNLSDDNLKKWAADLGLEVSRFKTCLDSGQFAEEVEKDVKEGESYGVTGTPTFFINGIRLSGAKSFEDFREVIEAELAK